MTAHWAAPPVASGFGGTSQLGYRPSPPPARREQGLVTNALRHGVPSAPGAVGDECIRLRLLAQSPFVICMVTDPGTDIPVLRDSGPTEESGRGLNVVESCSVRWGWQLFDEGGKIVWALLRPDL